MHPKMAIVAICAVRDRQEKHPKITLYSLCAYI